MSAFLGPIHFWVYDKIQRQEALTSDILRVAQEQGWSEHLSEKLEQTYGAPETGKLDDIIDVSNIHGWLQERVQRAEGRLAGAVTALLQEDAAREEALLAVCYENGRAAAAELAVDTPCTTLYEQLNTYWPDGMPCDRGVSLEHQDADSVIWSVSPAIHEGYWTALGQDPARYWQLRGAWTGGFVSEKNVSFARTNDTTFELRRA